MALKKKRECFMCRSNEDYAIGMTTSVTEHHFSQEGLARKLRFHIFRFSDVEGTSHMKCGFEIVDARISKICRNKRVLEDGGEACQAGGCRTPSVRAGSWPDKPSVELTVQASFLQLEFSKLAGSLAQKLPLSYLDIQILKEVSHESFAFTFSIFTSCTFRFGGLPRTKVSLSHLRRSDFAGRLARHAHLRDSGCTTCCAFAGIERVLED